MPETATTERPPEGFHDFTQAVESFGLDPKIMAQRINEATEIVRTAIFTLEDESEEEASLDQYFERHPVPSRTAIYLPSDKRDPRITKAVKKYHIRRFLSLANQEVDGSLDIKTKRFAEIYLRQLNEVRLKEKLGEMFLEEIVQKITDGAKISEEEQKFHDQYQDVMRTDQVRRLRNFGRGVYLKHCAELDFDDPALIFVDFSTKSQRISPRVLSHLVEGLSFWIIQAAFGAIVFQSLLKSKVFTPVWKEWAKKHLESLKDHDSDVFLLFSRFWGGQDKVPDFLKKKIEKKEREEKKLPPQTTDNQRQNTSSRAKKAATVPAAENSDTGKTPGSKNPLQTPVLSQKPRVRFLQRELNSEGLKERLEDGKFMFDLPSDFPENVHIWAKMYRKTNGVEREVENWEMEIKDGKVIMPEVNGNQLILKIAAADRPATKENVGEFVEASTKVEFSRPFVQGGFEPAPPVDEPETSIPDTAPASEPDLDEEGEEEIEVPEVDGGTLSILLDDYKGELLGTWMKPDYRTEEGVISFGIKALAFGEEKSLLKKWKSTRFDYDFAAQSITSPDPVHPELEQCFRDLFADHEMLVDQTYQTLKKRHNPNIRKFNRYSLKPEISDTSWFQKLNGSTDYWWNIAWTKAPRIVEGIILEAAQKSGVSIKILNRSSANFPVLEVKDENSETRVTLKVDQAGDLQLDPETPAAEMLGRGVFATVALQLARLDVFPAREKRAQSEKTIGSLKNAVYDRLFDGGQARVPNFNTDGVLIGFTKTLPEEMRGDTDILLRDSTIVFNGLGHEFDTDQYETARNALLETRNLKHLLWRLVATAKRDTVNGRTPINNEVVLKTLEDVLSDMKKTTTWLGEITDSADLLSQELNIGGEPWYEIFISRLELAKFTLSFREPIITDVAEIEAGKAEIPGVIR